MVQSVYFINIVFLVDIFLFFTYNLDRYNNSRIEFMAFHRERESGKRESGKRKRESNHNGYPSLAQFCGVDVRPLFPSLTGADLLSKSPVAPVGDNLGSGLFSVSPFLLVESVSVGGGVGVLSNYLPLGRSPGVESVESDEGSPSRGSDSLLASPVASAGNLDLRLPSVRLRFTPPLGFDEPLSPLPPSFDVDSLVLASLPVSPVSPVSRESPSAFCRDDSGVLFGGHYPDSDSVSDSKSTLGSSPSGEGECSSRSSPSAISAGVNSPPRGSAFFAVLSADASRVSPFDLSVNSGK